MFTFKQYLIEFHDEEGRHVSLKLTHAQWKKLEKDQRFITFAQSALDVSTFDDVRDFAFDDNIEAEEAYEDLKEILVLNNIKYDSKFFYVE